uniref:Uncharacterized protein n=1 Tax=Vespula pensylvanica TaxID=30213 RepID=A0A834KCN7_VESPE|nr:hypothetical protein H0235_014987 [Vespula pensylvanica]
MPEWPSKALQNPGNSGTIEDAAKSRKIEKLRVGRFASNRARAISTQYDVVHWYVPVRVVLLLSPEGSLGKPNTSLISSQPGGAAATVVGNQEEQEKEEEEEEEKEKEEEEEKEEEKSG